LIVIRLIKKRPNKAAGHPAALVRRCVVCILTQSPVIIEP
jgi:hypothetical protein